MKFRLDPSFTIDTQESPWDVEGLRIGLFGGPGSGKSWAASIFIEQFLSQGGTVIIFEPRSEYHVLKERFDIVVFGGAYNKDADFIASSPMTYAKAVVEEGVSLVFHTGSVEEEKLIDFTSKFVKYLLDLEETHKRPILLVLEETQELCPRSPSGHVAPPWVYNRMIHAFKKCFLEGRKLNVSAIAISPRPQEVNFTIRQLANLTFYGKFSPQDIHYIDSQCLKYYENSFYRGKDLLTLKTGQFAVITSGKPTPILKVTEPRLTKHGAETPSLTYVAPHKEETKKAIDSLTKTISEALAKEQAEESEVEKLRNKLKATTDQYGKLAEDYEKLKLQAETLGKIKIEAPQQNEKFDSALLLERTIRNLHQKIDDVFASYYKPPAINHSKKEDLWETWKDKMPDTMTMKIFKFLIDNTGAKYTKSEVARLLAYSASTSGVGTALSWLKRNNLIKREGDYYFVEASLSLHGST